MKTPKVGDNFRGFHHVCYRLFCWVNGFGDRLADLVYQAGCGFDKDDDWEEVLKMSDENNALFFDMFLKILPEGGQHKKLTMPNPSAVYIRSSNEMPYTADGLYSYPCLSANPAKEACDRLANFAMDSTFESTYLKQKKYWISDRNMGEYEFGDKVQKVDSVSQMMDIFLSRDYLLGDKREVKELVSSCRNEAGK